MSAVQVQRDLQEYLGGLVNLVFEDNTGNDVTVDAELGWQSLVKLIQVMGWTFFIRPTPPQKLTFRGRTIG
jgi:hypothetical protein